MHFKERHSVSCCYDNAVTHMDNCLRNQKPLAGRLRFPRLEELGWEAADKPINTAQAKTVQCVKLLACLPASCCFLSSLTSLI